MLDIFKGLRFHLLTLILAFLGGTVGYHFFYPDVPWNKLFFMTAITLSTVGYGDVLNVEQSVGATFFTIILMLVGLSIVLYSVSAITATFIDGNLGKIMKLKALYRRIAKMKDHYILCGVGQTGMHVMHELMHTGQNFVIIDSQADTIEQLTEQFPQLMIIEGDATSEHVLELANIEYAKGVIATLPSDKDNLFLVLTARMMNRKLKIAAKAIELSMVGKLKRAGAYYVVTPNFIGGMRMASEILRPNVVSFLDKMLRGQDKSIRISEITIPENSKFIGKPLAEIHTLEKYGVNILALNHKEHPNDFIYNPQLDTILQAEDTLVFIANQEQQERLEKII
jgi:voltage-gated potassium channel